MVMRVGRIVCRTLKIGVPDRASESSPAKNTERTTRIAPKTLPRFKKNVERVPDDPTSKKLKTASPP